ncbi:MAG: flagellar basal body P-ring formation chaperone FlgA [Rhodobacteraceae bacterium]|nr:flagellar basal body P-ring formation chaperone FlgA [Paracoccaceae bacterium]
MRALWLLLILCPVTAFADSIVAARTIRAHSLLVAEDLDLVPDALPGTASDPRALIGLEARVTLYQGRAIRPDQLGPRTSVERNQLVTIAYRRSGITILAEGRALARGAAGEVIRVMNTSSRTTVSGLIAADGTVLVQP